MIRGERNAEGEDFEKREQSVIGDQCDQANDLSWTIFF